MTVMAAPHQHTSHQHTTPPGSPQASPVDRAMFHVKHRAWTTRVARMARTALTTLAASALFLAGCTGDVAPAKGWASPVVTANSTLLIQSGPGRVTAVKADGSRIADFELKGVTTRDFLGRERPGAATPFYATPLTDGTTAYLASYGGRVARLSLENGSFTEKWVVDLRESIVATPVLRGDRLYVSAESGQMLVLNAANGQTVTATRPTVGRVWGAPALQQSRIYIGTLDSSEMIAVNADTGATEWRQGVVGATAADLVVDSDLLLVASFDRTLHALELADGRERWRFAGDGWFVGRPLATPRAIYAATMQGSVYALDRTGRELWRFTRDNDKFEVRAAPILAGETLIVAGRDGTFVGLHAATGVQQWTRTAEKTAIEANGVLLESVVFFTTTDYRLLRLDPASGDLKTFNVQPPTGDGK